MNRSIFKTLAVSSVFAISANAQTLQDGLRALDFDKFESARNIFTSLTKTAPADGDNWYYLGQSYLNLYKEDSAKWAYNEGVKAAPANASNYVGLGELLMAENKKADAKIQFDKALGLSRGRDGMVKDPKALRLVASAMVSTDNKITDEALGYIRAALEIAPKDYNVLIAAGDVYLEMNNGGEAATQYERAETVEPKNPKAFTRVAAIWIRVRNAEQTLTDLNKALAIDPNYAPALKLMSELYYKSKKYEKAKEYYTKYLQNSEYSVANRTRFARILFNSKEYEDALSQILDIQETNKEDIYMYRLAGYSYYEVGAEGKDTSKFRPGAVSLETFMAKIDPSKILASDYEYLGKLYSRIPGSDSLAISNMQKALEMAPEKIELNKEAAAVFGRLRKFDQATAYYEEYLAKTDKPNAADYYLLGIYAYNSKQFPKADTAFSKLIETKPDYPDGYYWRGNTQANIDTEAKDTLARYNYERYISMVEATPEKAKKNLINSYDYIAKYYVKQEKNALAKTYLNKILALDPGNKEAKSLLSDLNKAN
jgi:tetratricopeptide (TPR) repeat protein